MFREVSGGNRQCKVCQLVLGSEMDVRVHMMQHAGSKSLCQFCDQQFATVKALRMHVNLSHPGLAAGNYHYV